MNADTYEFETTKKTLETYEWDRMWVDHPYDTKSKRALYIGDSISYGTRKVVSELAENTWRWDGFATSKGADNPFFSDTLRLFRKQVLASDVVLFNNGLHGWHLDDQIEYSNAIEGMLNDHTRNERVKTRNEVVKRIAEKYQLHVLDLYTVSEENRSLMLNDGVHFTSEGYEALAKTILSFFTK